MVKIKISKGLDIPIEGKPVGNIRKLTSPELLSPELLSLNLFPFEEINFKLLAAPGDVVKIGQPLAEDLDSPGRMFVSPAGGVIKEIRQQSKERYSDIVIQASKDEERIEYPTLSPSASREQIIERLKIGGLFSHIRSRPFNLLADPKKMPRSIFVKAVETAPLVPPAEFQVRGFESEFQLGLDVLAKLTSGTVHLIHSAKSDLPAFLGAKNVEIHSVEGPHPAGNASVHIHYIDPIKKVDETVWTLTAFDVVCIGQLIGKGIYHTEKVISIAGDGLLDNTAGFYSGRMGYSIADLMAGHVQSAKLRYISGDVLTGRRVYEEDFLGFYDTSFSVIPENTEREFLSFLRMGTNKFTATGAYVSGHLNNAHREYHFTTSLHGEKRPFVDGSVYDRVMPLPISIMHLAKAVLAKDFKNAMYLGLLEVDSEDFALPTFICPSKMELEEIIKKGLKTCLQFVNIKK